MTSAFKSADEELADVLRGSLQRIELIVADLDRTAHPKQGDLAEDLPSLISAFVREKKIELKSYAQLELQFENHGCSRSTARLSGTELVRILSNLTNNAAEAIGAKNPGHISISLTEDRKHFHVSISDTGPGIPADILPKLGSPGFSHGKSTGKGLGIESAMTVLRLVGGTLQFTSPIAFNRGTRVNVLIPKG